MAIDTSAIGSAAAFQDEDVGNIMLLEHVNVQVPDQNLATLFYIVGMGFTRDPHMMVGLENMWANLGEQQFHLPTNVPQVLRGHAGIVMPSLAALAERLTEVAPRLAGTRFEWSQADGYVAVTSPWGNRYRCYEPSPEFGSLMLGIAYVQLDVPRDTAEGIAAFYEQALGAISSVEAGANGKAALVGIGQYQHLIFSEGDSTEPYDGHHIAIYVANFSHVYDFLAARDLITEAPANHQLRFQAIVDPATGRELFRLEHEVRGLRHVQYRRPLVNRSPGQYLEPMRRDGQTLLGRVL